MSLAPLAEVANLPSRWQADANAARALAVASSAIREAAGNLIGPPVIATVSVTGTPARLLALPRPATAITAVMIDDRTAPDYKALPAGLWRPAGRGFEPSVWEVTAPSGPPPVPPD